MTNKKLPPGTRGKLVLRSIPSPEVGDRVSALLSRLVKNLPPERIRAVVQRPPVVLFKNLTVEKAGKVVAALQKAGAAAAFVPHRPGDVKRPERIRSRPQAREAPVPIVPPPGRRLRKWLGITAATCLLLAAAAALTVSLFPLVRPEGLYRPPIPDRAHLSGFRPTSEAPPGVEAVPAVDMPAALDLRYRPGPDRRFVEALRIIASQHGLFTGSTTVPAGFSVGPILSDGRQVRIPAAENGAPFLELRLPLPVAFEQGLAACRRLYEEICARGGGPPCAPAPGEKSGSLIEAGFHPDPQQMIDALYRLEALRKQKGPDTALFSAAALASARLLETLQPDAMKAGDRIAAHALAFLAAAGGGGETPPREEAELALAMGYTGHAAKLAARHPERFTDAYGRMLTASLQADVAAMEAAASPAPAGARLLAARTFRRLGLHHRARQETAALLSSAPGLHPVLCEAVLSAGPDEAAGVSAAYPEKLLSDLAIEPLPAEGGGIVSPDRFSSSLQTALATRYPEEGGLFIDRRRAASVWKGLYLQSLLLRFDFLMDRADGPDMPAAERLARTIDDAPGHPLAVYAKGRLLARIGGAGAAAEAAGRVSALAGAPAGLCLSVWRAAEPADRLRLAPALVQRLDGSPQDGFILAAVLQEIWHLDAAKSRFRQVLAIDPYRVDALLALCRVTGSASPIEETIRKRAGAVWPAAAAAAYWIEKNSPEALQRALAFADELRRIDPDNPTWIRQTAEILSRRSQTAEAARRLEQYVRAAAKSGRPAPAEDKIRLARLYLQLKQPKKATALIGEERDAGHPEAMILAANALAMSGIYDKALAACEAALLSHPSSLPVMSGAAAFHWRLGRFTQATALIEEGRSRRGLPAGWYVDPFFSVFAPAERQEIVRAVESLKAAGVGAGEVRPIARRFYSAGRRDIALQLMREIRHPTPAEEIEAAAEAAAMLAAWKGPDAADPVIKPFSTGPEAMRMAEALFAKGLYGRVLDCLGRPDAQAAPNPEYAWLLRTLAWIASGSEPGQLKDSLVRHYSGNWLQQKAARITGILSDDPHHAAGRYLMGMISLEEMMSWAKGPGHRCTLAYCAGVSERLRGRYAAATRWYMACRAVCRRDFAAHRWAEEELRRWARTGAEHRSETMPRDLAYLRTKGEAWR